MRRVSLTQGQTASHKSPSTPRHDATVFGGGERGHLRPHDEVGTLMKRVRHFCGLGRWSGDLGSVESIENAVDVTTRTADEYERASRRAAGVAASWAGRRVALRAAH